MERNQNIIFCEVKMALTAAEKQRRYRERLRLNNPEKYEEFRLKNVARNRVKQRKKIQEYTEAEKLILRKQWRNNKRKTLKRQRQNLRDNYGNPLTSCKASTRKSEKLDDRLKFWPPKRMSKKDIERPHLEVVDIDSIKRTDGEDDVVAPTPLTDTTPVNTDQSQSSDLFQSQNDTPSHRKSSLDQSRSQVDKAINFTNSNTDEDDIDLLFKSYAKKLKTMTKRRQATVKFEIANLMLKAELEECDEIHPRLNNGQFVENNTAMVVEPTASSATSDANYSAYIKSSPSPVIEIYDPPSPPYTRTP